MRRIALLMLFLLASAATATAQDSATPGARRAIEERFTARIRTALELSDEQAARLKEVSERHAASRRALQARQRIVRTGLAMELRELNGSRPDSVARLTDELLDLKVRMAEAERDEMRELAEFLEPVQRARFLALRERLLQQARRAREPAGPERPRRR